MRMPICFNVDMTKEYDVDRLLKFALQRARMKFRKEEVITIIIITTITITIIEALPQRRSALAAGT